jgi:hypothetical protein
VHHFDFGKSSPLRPLGSHLLKQPLAQAATWQPLGSHLLQPLGASVCEWLQVAASGCLSKWLPSGCQVAAKCHLEKKVIL